MRAKPQGAASIKYLSQNLAFCFIKYLGICHVQARVTVIPLQIWPRTSAPQALFLRVRYYSGHCPYHQKCHQSERDGDNLESSVTLYLSLSICLSSLYSSYLSFSNCILQHLKATLQCPSKLQQAFPLPVRREVHLPVKAFITVCLFLRNSTANLEFVSTYCSFKSQSVIFAAHLRSTPSI